MVIWLYGPPSIILKIFSSSLYGYTVRRPLSLKFFLLPYMVIRSAVHYPSNFFFFFIWLYGPPSIILQIFFSSSLYGYTVRRPLSLKFFLLPYMVLRSAVHYPSNFFFFFIWLYGPPSIILQIFSSSLYGYTVRRPLSLKFFLLPYMVIRSAVHYPSNFFFFFIWLYGPPSIILQIFSFLYMVIRSAVHYPFFFIWLYGPPSIILKIFSSSLYGYTVRRPLSLKFFLLLYMVIRSAVHYPSKSHMVLSLSLNFF